MRRPSTGIWAGALALALALADDSVAAHRGRFRRAFADASATRRGAGGGRHLDAAARSSELVSKLGARVTGARGSGGAQDVRGAGVQRILGRFQPLHVRARTRGICSSSLHVGAQRILGRFQPLHARARPRGT